jgi:hypothetical protein
VSVAIGKITVGGSLIGGAGDFSGNIQGSGAIGPVTIKGSFVGGSGLVSGKLESNAKTTSVTVGGSVLGGAGEDSGVIHRSLLRLIANKITLHHNWAVPGCPRPAANRSGEACAAEQLLTHS